MNAGGFSLSILVLTEDSACDAHEGLLALAKKMFQIVEPDCSTHRVRFDPQGAEAREAMVANRWKSTSGRDEYKRRALVRAIATRILESDPPGFVLFHFDGDRAWARRDSGENARKFSDLIRVRVEQLLRSVDLDETSRIAALGRLLPLIPYYSIEAWLYQNTREAIALCRSHHQGRDVDRFESWAQDRTLLDEVVQPKEVVCLGSNHNARLAQRGFPAEEVYLAERSFTASVDGLRACAALKCALMNTVRASPE